MQEYTFELNGVVYTVGSHPINSLSNEEYGWRDDPPKTTTWAEPDSGDDWRVPKN